MNRNIPCITTAEKNEDYRIIFETFRERFEIFIEKKTDAMIAKGKHIETMVMLLYDLKN